MQPILGAVIFNKPEDTLGLARYLTEESHDGTQARWLRSEFLFLKNERHMPIVLADRIDAIIDVHTGPHRQLRVSSFSNSEPTDAESANRCPRSAPHLD